MRIEKRQISLFLKACSMLCEGFVETVRRLLEKKGNMVLDPLR
jgi:hypothetical protein